MERAPLTVPDRGAWLKADEAMDHFRKILELAGHTNPSTALAAIVLECREAMRADR
jgi:hypothetical protein